MGGSNVPELFKTTKADMFLGFSMRIEGIYNNFPHNTLLPYHIFLWLH